MDSLFSTFVDLLRRENLQAMAYAPVCLASGLLLRYVRALRSLPGLVGLGLVCAVLVFREAALAYGLTLGAVYLFTVGLHQATGGAKPDRKRRWRGALLGIAAVAGLFVVGRHLDLGGFRVSFLHVGLALFWLDMWTVLRLVTFLWEIGGGRIQPPGPWRFWAWGLLPFTLVGPVLRYSEGERFLGPAALSSEAPLEPLPPRFWLHLLSAAAQLSAGLALRPLALALTAGWPPSWSPLVKAISIFGYGPWGFLLAAAGYFRVMEATALLAGMRLPPSFDRPFGRRNLSDFWANWNMTATRVFKDYVFLNRWGMKVPNLYLNSLLVFGLCGLWHASNPYWILWGLLHGAGFAAFLWYRQRRTRRGAPAPAAAPSPLFHVLGSAATYAFVCLAWYVPSKLLQRIGWA